jgi:hypothetical protein
VAIYQATGRRHDFDRKHGRTHQRPLGEVQTPPHHDVGNQDGVIGQDNVDRSWQNFTIPRAHTDELREQSRDNPLMHWTW